MEAIDFHPPKLAGRHLNVLLYAAAAALISRTIIGTRRMLQAFNLFCEEYKLEVNHSKTKAFAARPRIHSWFLGGIQLEQVNQFKYLGQVFQANRSFSAHREYVTMNANRVALIVRTLFAKEKVQHVDIALKLFLGKVLPLLMVGII